MCKSRFLTANTEGFIVVEIVDASTDDVIAKMPNGREITVLARDLHPLLITDAEFIRLQSMIILRSKT